MRWTRNGKGGYPKHAGLLNLSSVEASGDTSWSNSEMVTSKRTRKPKLVTSSPKATAVLVQQVSLSTDFQEAIRSRAYSIYERRGCEHGHDLDDWLIAEADLSVKPMRSLPEHVSA
jgi:hypothetical protein